MSTRLLSSTTLLEGMKTVAYQGAAPNADRKRELEAAIEAGFCACHVHTVSCALVGIQKQIGSPSS